MTQTRHTLRAMPRLALSLFVLLLLPASLSIAQTPDDAAARQAALLAKRPAKLRRPPPQIAGQPRSEKSGVQQAQYVVEELPPEMAPAPGQSSFVQPGFLGGRYGAAGEPFEDYGPGFFPDQTAACPPSCLWGRAEYLLWWVEGFSTPPLVTTSPDGTAQVNAGILGVDGTNVLFGGDRLADQSRSGVRLTLGGWFDGCASCGIQASVFGLATENTSFSRTSDESPILARPFFNVEPGFEGQDAELIAFPGLFEGRVDVRSESSLNGAEVLLRHCLAQSGCWRVDALGGWRYARLHDMLRISDSRTVTGAGAGLAIGTTFEESDLFDTVNQFNGGELGFVAQMHHCRCWLEGTLKLAIGSTHSNVRIDGDATATVPIPGAQPQVVETSAGLLAQQTNIGTYTDNRVSVIPELGFNLGCDVTPNIRAIVGYTFMYWTDVLRPGDQIDPNLNLSQLTAAGLNGIPRPQFRPVTDDLWIQGLSLGLDGRF